EDGVRGDADPCPGLRGLLAEPMKRERAEFPAGAALRVEHLHARAVRPHDRHCGIDDSPIERLVVTVLDERDADRLKESSGEFRDVFLISARSHAIRSVGPPWVRRLRILLRGVST